MAKTAKEKLQEDKQSKTVILDKDFAGVKKGQKLFIATPQIVDDYIKKIPYGEIRTIVGMRDDIAISHQCDASCPVSTAIFIRISAQAAIDELDSGKSTKEVTPFWCLLDSNDKISKKLTIDAKWLDHQRLSEQTAL